MNVGCGIAAGGSVRDELMFLERMKLCGFVCRLKEDFFYENN